MNYISVISPSVRLMAVFIMILVLIRRKLSLGAAFISGCVALNLIFGMGPGETLKIIGSSALLKETWVLSVMVALILMFSQSMENTGQMSRMITSFRGLVRIPGLNLALFPALIGLLPMPGGAVFSAPMVRELGQGIGFSGQRLSLINYWFRHIWEYWWPLYPGVLLAITISKIGIVTFIATLFPFSIVAILTGVLIILRPSSLRADKQLSPPSSPWPFFRELFPVLVIIAGGPLLGWGLSFVMPESSVPIEAGLIVCLILATLWVWKKNAVGPDKIWNQLKNPDLYMMIFMIFSVLAFKNSLEGSGAVTMITRELLDMNIPVPMLAGLLPFFVGLITGISMAFVGISLPILIPLIVSAGDGELLSSYTMLVMISGFCGVLLSPLHLCLILSNGYFKAPMGEAYKTLVPLVMIIGLLGITFFYAKTMSAL